MNDKNKKRDIELLENFELLINEYMDKIGTNDFSGIDIYGALCTAINTIASIVEEEK